MKKGTASLRAVEGDGQEHSCYFVATLAATTRRNDHKEGHLIGCFNSHFAVDRCRVMFSLEAIVRREHLEELDNRRV